MKTLLSTILVVCLASLGALAQQPSAPKKPTDRPSQKTNRNTMDSQGNKNDQNMMRRQRDELRSDSLRMKQDTARMMFDSSRSRNQGSHPNGQAPGNATHGNQNVRTNVQDRGERSRMEQPPTPNNRRDSLRPR
jgi:hypothetical protein